MSNHSDWQNTNLLTLGLELDSRAKQYSIEGSSTSEFFTEGVVTFRQLEKRVLYTETKRPGEWEWVFEPLIYKLLSTNKFSWICLGNYIGDRENAKRRWLYFLSQDLSPNENIINFARAFRVLSFNAIFHDLAASSVIMTSQLLEKSFPLVLTNESDYPLGALLFLSIQKNNTDLINSIKEKKNLRKQFFLFDWSSLYPRISANLNRHLILAKAASNDYIFDYVNNQVDDSEKIIPFLWNNNKLLVEEVKELAEAYANELINVFKDDKTINLEDYIDPFYKFCFKQPLREDISYHKRVLTYAALAYDVTEQTGEVLNIPAWLPGEGSQGTSGSILLYIKQGHIISESELLEMISAFRLGCVNVSIEAAQSKDKSSDPLLHQIPKSLIAGLDELYKQNVEPPSNFIQIMFYLYKTKKEPKYRPRFPHLEKSISKNGVSEATIEFLFNNIACSLGFQKLTSTSIFLEDESYPILNLNTKEKNDWYFSLNQNDDVIYLIIILALLLTEAWEHTARHYYQTKKTKTVFVEISRDRIYIGNPCDLSLSTHSSILLQSNSNQNGEITSLEDNSIWQVVGPDRESIQAGIWNRIILKRDF